MMWPALFWVFVCLMVYIYAGYPLLVRVLARLFGRPVAKAAMTPEVTIIVAAFNEERCVREKLDGLLQLDYPADHLRIIVASDGSTDATDAIVRSYGDPRVTLLRVEGRVGKTACQNQAVKAATSEIIVFTDATTRLGKDALRTLVGNFSDPAVGCVAARLVYVGKGDSLTAEGGTAYWNYEIGLRMAESRLHSLVGVSGCLYGVRRAAYRDIEPHLISDFVIALRMQEQGLRTVLEPGAVCFEETLERSAQELSMRIRVAIRSIGALVGERRMMNPFRHGWFAFELISHKALRYASPFIWAGAILASVAAANQLFYLTCFLLQVALVLLGILGFHLQSRGSLPKPLSKPYYFLLTNLASLIATFRFMRGERIRVWNPVR
jgi:cellulose synthase/poly-beta-1,6-N-acetylglucosamine synthase-like glycosyltransferase